MAKKDTKATKSASKKSAAKKETIKTARASIACTRNPWTFENARIKKKRETIGKTINIRLMHRSDQKSRFYSRRKNVAYVWSGQR